jgi:ABC-type nickel/cobalt efflux system permease component RcnA
LPTGWSFGEGQVTIWSKDGALLDAREELSVTALASLLVLGFFLGMRHATDPDHVIAISTIVARQRRVGAAAWVGALWGIGHTLTILAVGGAILVFGLVIPPRLGLTMEFSVALMLVLLGLLNLSGALRWIHDALGTAGAVPGRLHSHAHHHDDYVHSHPHGHGRDEHGHAEDRTPQAWMDRTFGELGFYHVVRPVVVGLVHGLAGSAAVALLVLATVRDPWWGTAYLLVFGVGTVAGMMLITASLALPITYAAGRFAHVNRYLATASGLLSLAFGLFLVYQIGFVDGLFTGDPRWTPE